MRAATGGFCLVPARAEPPFGYSDPRPRALLSTLMLRGTEPVVDGEQSPGVSPMMSGIRETGVANQSQRTGKAHVVRIVGSPE
jgi:hypothetical protein